MKVQVSNANTPVWRDITVESRMPAQLNILQEMARNIWWVWNNEALSMFKSIDPEIWKAVNGNPVMLLNRVSYERLEEIVADKSMMYTINAQYEKFRLQKIRRCGTGSPAPVKISHLCDTSLQYFRSQRQQYRHGCRGFPLSLRLFYPDSLDGWSAVGQL